MLPSYKHDQHNKLIGSIELIRIRVTGKDVLTMASSTKKKKLYTQVASIYETKLITLAGWQLRSRTCKCEVLSKGYTQK